MKTQFVCYYHYVSWKSLAFGASVWLSPFNIEIHLPTGFIRIGWTKVNIIKPINHHQVEWRTFGLTERYEY